MEPTFTITAWKDNEEVKSEKEEPDTLYHVQPIQLISVHSCPLICELSHWSVEANKLVSQCCPISVHITLTHQLLHRIHLTGNIPKYAKKISSTPPNHPHQPEPLRQGNVDPCFHAVYTKFWWILETHQIRQPFSNLILSNLGKLVRIMVSDSCS